MAHGSKNLKMQLNAALVDILHKSEGRSRNEDKKAHCDKLYIYSYQTYQTYKQQLRYFCDFVKVQHPDCKLLHDARQYADEYLTSLIQANMSPYTIKLVVAALCKLYGDSADKYIKTPARNRVNITRSRERVVRDSGFSEELNADLVEFCRSTGLRRNELQHLRGDYMRIAPDGSVWLDFTGSRANACKGGRPRSIRVYGDSELVKRLCKAAGSSLVFGKVNTHMDVHSYRAEYANRVYSAHARSDIPKEDSYRCRGDKAGVVLDKAALQIASEMLGHSRIEVIPSNYSYSFES